MEVDSKKDKEILINGLIGHCLISILRIITMVVEYNINEQYQSSLRIKGIFFDNIFISAILAEFFLITISTIRYPFYKNIKLWFVLYGIIMYDFILSFKTLFINSFTNYVVLMVFAFSFIAEYFVYKLCKFTVKKSFFIKSFRLNVDIKVYNAYMNRENIFLIGILLLYKTIIFISRNILLIISLDIENDVIDEYNFYSKSMVVYSFITVSVNCFTTVIIQYKLKDEIFYIRIILILLALVNIFSLPVLFFLLYIKDAIVDINNFLRISSGILFSFIYLDIFLVYYTYKDIQNLDIGVTDVQVTKNYENYRTN
ncbi:hypothetical protein HERIO_182 [Hepatospora eriocheir]|uniref:Uncharacterized protein n=1 Tax=Hepatospora eriocheir TaxID=1081669 RepID=A0A1X0QE33_9MICR|nr:hypothetical protein HERIO_182 [Hepatospora eriocheir]